MQIKYVTVNSKRSPLYRDHDTEITVDFSNLKINANTITLLHLQPFIHVLLGRTSSKSSLDHKNSEDTLNQHVEVPPERNKDAPFGMLLTLMFKTLDLHLFRVFSDEFYYERELDETYAVKAENLTATVSLKELMCADVRIANFHVSDTRDASADYIFRTIFSPAVFEEDGSPSLPELRSRDKNYAPIPGVKLQKRLLER